VFGIQLINIYIMKFETGQSVIVLDSENKAAGTGNVISSDEGGLYLIAFTYNASDKKEDLVLPEHRLMLNVEPADKELKISSEL
jgi:hypothetical protein